MCPFYHLNLEWIERWILHIECVQVGVQYSFLMCFLPPPSSSACLLERRTDGRTAGATGATGGGGRADDVSSGELPAVVVAVSGRRQWSLFCCEVFPLERFCRHGSFHHE
jgi:hypothetical protein